MLPWIYYTVKGANCTGGLGVSKEGSHTIVPSGSVWFPLKHGLIVVVLVVLGFDVVDVVVVVFLRLIARRAAAKPSENPSAKSSENFSKIS